MGAEEGPTGLRQWLPTRRLSRLCLLSATVTGCWMLLTFQPLHPEHHHHHQQQQQQQQNSTGGRYRGRPLRDMWAQGLPETAWFSDRQCCHLVTRYTCDGCVDAARLASFPRSGNTWTRYLLETATGIFTSTNRPLLQDYRQHGELRHNASELWRLAREARQQVVRLGHLGEDAYWTQGHTIAVKTHGFPQPWPGGDEGAHPERLMPFRSGSRRRAILLVRDPFKALISTRVYSTSASLLSNGTDVRGLFVGDDWAEFVRYFSRNWYDMNTRWLEATNDTLVVRYEHLVGDPMHQLEEMLRFLEVEPDPARIECVRRHVEGRAHNKKHDAVPDDATFPVPLRAAVWTLIHQLNMVMKDGGFGSLPLERYSFAEEFMDIGL